jgi:hypothetical protein
MCVPFDTASEHYPTLCNVLENPSQWSAGQQGPDGTYTDSTGWRQSGPSWSGVWTDFHCNDGSGFDHYRVFIDDAQMSDGSRGFVERRTLAAVDAATSNPADMDWVLWNSGPMWSTYGGNLMYGSLTTDQDGIEPGSVTICGYKGTAAECHGDPHKTGSGAIWPFLYNLNLTMAGRGDPNI